MTRIIFPPTIDGLTPYFVRRLLHYQPAQAFAAGYIARGDEDEAVGIATLKLIEVYPRLRLDDPGVLFAACGWIATALKSDVRKLKRIWTNVKSRPSIYRMDDEDADRCENWLADPVDHRTNESVCPFTTLCGDDATFMRDVGYNGPEKQARTMGLHRTTVYTRRRKVMQRLQQQYNPVT